jgi:hypothetical protein
MAIKSKGRPRGGKAVATAPRRPLVVRKPPVWRRPWVWAIVGLLALGGILAAVVLTLQNNGRESARNREHDAVQTIFNQVRSALPTDTQPIPPDALAIFPSVQEDFESFGTDIKGADLKKRGEDISADAEQSVTKLQAISIQDAIPEKFAADRDALDSAQFLMSTAVGMYQKIGALIASTSQLAEGERQAVLDQVQLLMNDAGVMFDQGYLKLTTVAKSYGIPVDTPFNPPPAAPPSPTPTASVSPSASGSPEASATPTEGASPSASPSESPGPSASPSA